MTENTQISMGLPSPLNLLLSDEDRKTPGVWVKEILGVKVSISLIWGNCSLLICCTITELGTDKLLYRSKKLPSSTQSGNEIYAQIQNFTSSDF